MTENQLFAWIVLLTFICGGEPDIWDTAREFLIKVMQ